MRDPVNLELPRFNGWMLPDDASAILHDLIHVYGPELILEVGSGRSTVLLADAVRELGGHVVSLDHDDDFRTVTEETLRRNSLTAFAEVRHAPLEPNTLGLPDWYARAAWEDLDAIGMLVVDGPPGHLSPFSREPALPLVRDRLLPGALVVLDDSNRAAEKEILVRWGIETTYVKHSTGAMSWGILA